MKTILTLCLFLAIAGNLTAQNTAKGVDSTLYHGKSYALSTGLKGGLFFITEDSVKHYRVRSVSPPKDNGNGTARYKDADWKIFTGSRGGRYIVYKGQKIYIPKS